MDTELLVHITFRNQVLKSSLREKCPYTKFFSGLYFPVFNPNTGKYGPDETPYLDTFHASRYMQKTHVFASIKT